MHTVYGMTASGSWAFAVGDDGAIFHQLFAGEISPYGLDLPESAARFDASYDKILQDLVEGSFIWKEGVL